MLGYRPPSGLKPITRMEAFKRDTFVHFAPYVCEVLLPFVPTLTSILSLQKEGEEVIRLIAYHAESLNHGFSF